MNIYKYFKKALKQPRNQAGFGLSDIIVAITIVSLGTSVSAAYLDDTMAAARDAQRMGNIKQVQTALNLYYDDNLVYPISSSDEPTIEAWQDMKVYLEDNQPWPYMPKVPVDPLDEGEYQFKYWSNGQVFKLIYETEDVNDESPRIVWGL